MNFIRENVAAIRYEIWAAYWLVRCTMAADAARLSIIIAEYCQRRGPRSKVAFWIARQFLWLSRKLVPGALKPLTEAVCEQAQ